MRQGSGGNDKYGFGENEAFYTWKESCIDSDWSTLLVIDTLIVGQILSYQTPPWPTQFPNVALQSPTPLVGGRPLEQITPKVDRECSLTIYAYRSIHITIVTEVQPPTRVVTLVYEERRWVILVLEGAEPRRPASRALPTQQKFESTSTKSEKRYEK